ncbi:BirA family biotin operon repressor/biotin-(acetyl-CoA-carboxylase) ligase [Rubrivivax sp. A210]|uniref:biotin--[acetyl-CoA-carboxylase] ligase n=1 Tax=Rubrivivax sp. A210 TaxID=2772301 RepID=UPI0019193850|nr:biotin--[acetyl-CoA-carboxylase] ligase [Rubrivivax sp. A210]CAD5371812.1 BirA family biotin operon repressor/biotin-(acetyl-CoA-carboxylase) ligase [Rubrivivax sp. A210]
MNNRQHLSWGATALWERLAPLLPGIAVEVVARADSTNTRLLDRARNSSGLRDAPITRPGEIDAGHGGPRTPHGRRRQDLQPCLLVAEEQTQGRGRLGRDWVASAGASLTFSLALPLAPAQWSGLSLAVGLALAEALDPAEASAAPRIGLKWPNDLWLLESPGRGRKLGGILIETVSVGEHRVCVIGVGLNVLPQPAEGLAHGYACLRELDPEISAPRALALVTEPLVRAIRRFESEGFATFVAAYRQRDLLLGQPVTVAAPEPFDGEAEGVDAHGALLVRSGEVHSVVSGEVSVRLHRA